MQLFEPFLYLAVIGSLACQSKQMSAFTAPSSTQSHIAAARHIQDMPGSSFMMEQARPRYHNSGAFVHGTKFRNFAPIMEQGLASEHVHDHSR